MLGMLMVAVLAQGGGGEPPDGAEAAEAVMREFFEDVAAERWLAAAALFHPDALERFRAESLEQARQLEAPPPAESFYPEDMPQAVRDWFDEQRAKHEAEGSDTYFAPAPWLVSDSVASMTGAELLARMLEHTDPRTEMRRAMEVQGAPQALEGLARHARVRHRVIGAIAPDETHAYVLYDVEPGLTGPASPFSSIAVATLRRHGDAWRIWTHQNWPAAGWIGHASMIYSGPATAPDPGLEFRWPEGEDAALTAVFERTGDAPPTLRLTVQGEAGGLSRLSLPPDAVDALIEYLVFMSAVAGREPEAH